MVDLWYRRSIAKGTLQSDFIVILAPSFYFPTCVFKGHEAVCLDALSADLASECFDEGVIFGILRRQSTILL